MKIIRSFDKKNKEKLADPLLESLALLRFITLYLKTALFVRV
jgi:hypothetical protein